MGRTPAFTNVYGPVPPLAVNVTGPKGEPAATDGTVGGSTVIVTPTHVTVTTYSWLPTQPAASVATP